MTGLEGRGAAGRSCPPVCALRCHATSSTMRWAQGETPRPHGEGEGPPKAPG